MCVSCVVCVGGGGGRIRESEVIRTDLDRGWGKMF